MLMTSVSKCLHVVCLSHIDHGEMYVSDYMLVCLAQDLDKMSAIYLADYMLVAQARIHDQNMQADWKRCEM